MAHPLPLATSEITAEWLSDALSRPDAAVTVSSATERATIWGTATKVLLDVTYGRATDLPTQLCVKGGFVPELLELMAHGYATEGRFYRDLATSVPKTPRCHFSGTDETTGQTIVVLDDLTATEGHFHDATGTLTVDQVADGLETLAALHSRPITDAAWLDTTPFFQPMVGGLLERPDWSAVAAAASPVVATLLDDNERIKAAFADLWAIEAAATPVIIHGDANPTNVFIEPGGGPVFVDWQFVCLGDPIHDVALFMMGALAIEDRRDNEIQLLHHYLDARSGAAESFDDTWTSYRRHSLHGAMYTFTPDEMQPAPLRAALAERYASAADDLDTLAAIQGT